MGTFPCRMSFRRRNRGADSATYNAPPIVEWVTGAVARRSSLGCIRRFQLRARLGTTVAPFPATPRQTVREVFPHTAFLWEVRAPGAPSLLRKSRSSSVLDSFRNALLLTFIGKHPQQESFPHPELCCLWGQQYYDSIRLPHRLYWTSAPALYQQSPPRLIAEGQ